MKTIKPKLVLLALLSAFSLQPSALLAQGSLTPPPGAPGATMLTLSQIEPRTPVDATHTGSGGSAKFLITQPGSYYLTTNIVGVSSEHGINISANNVTLDLNGFSLQGVSGALDGVYIHAGYTNVTVRNGSISGWVSSFGGVEDHANNAILEGLNISANANGIVLESSGVVRDCNCNNNFGVGIQVYAGMVSGCEALNNSSTGIYVGSGTVSDCDALTNANYGIYVGNNCTVKDCTASGNTSYGIYVANNSTVIGCTAGGNTADSGIYVGNTAPSRIAPQAETPGMALMSSGTIPRSPRILAATIFMMAS